MMSHCRVISPPPQKNPPVHNRHIWRHKPFQNTISFRALMWRSIWFCLLNTNQSYKAANTKLKPAIFELNCLFTLHKIKTISHSLRTVWLSPHSVTAESTNSGGIKRALKYSSFQIAFFNSSRGGCRGHVSTAHDDDGSSGWTRYHRLCTLLSKCAKVR